MWGQYLDPFLLLTHTNVPILDTVGRPAAESVPSSLRGKGPSNGEDEALITATTSSGGKRGAMSRRMLKWLSRICPHVIVFARVAPDQKVS